MAVVVVSGEVDLAVQDELAKLVLDAVQAEAISEVVVDLAQTTFMGSAGIHALISGREAASHAGVKYHVRGASGIVRQVLDISGVLEILESPDGGA